MIVTKPPTVPGRDLKPGPLSLEESFLLTEVRMTGKVADSVKCQFSYIFQNKNLVTVVKLLNFVKY